MPEERLYNRVEKFLQEKFKCFATARKMGSKRVGFADVVGVKDIGGAYSENIQVIAVEVKSSRYGFAKFLGQALGYSLFAHRCYLAVPLRYNEDFTLEEKEMATRLGVGLIGITRKECREFLTSPNHQPIDSLMIKMLEYMGYAKCNICGTLMLTEAWTGNLKRAVDQEKAFYYGKLIEDRPILFTDRPYRWVSICSDCIKNLKLNKIK